MVEQTENGEPKGKFLALQIKSGEGNFYVSTNKIVYYLSNVHYEYWINFDIPVILVAYLPSQEKTYWEEISQHKIKRTGKKWKLEIPVKNVLNKKAKPFLTQLLTSKNKSSDLLKILQGENIGITSLHHLQSRIDLLADATESTTKTVGILEEFQVKIRASGEKFYQYNIKGDYNNSPQVKNTIKSFAKDITIEVRRLENEILIFSEVFGEGIFAFEQAIILHFNITKSSIALQDNLESLNIISPALEGAISGIVTMRQGFVEIPENYRELKIAKTNGLQVIDLMIKEYEDAKGMTDGLIELIRMKF